MIRRVEFEILEEKLERVRDTIILKYVIFEDEIVFSVSEDELLEDKIVFFEFIELL